MTQPSLPVLFLSDLVVLPGMVVPIPLDEAAQAAVDAARASSGSELLLAPRLEDRYASYGVVATVEDVREGMEKSQREFLLRQQLAAIRKELGEGEPEGSEDYRARVEAAEVPDD